MPRSTSSLISRSAVSGEHFPISAHFDDVSFQEGKEYEPFTAYALSKCANVYFSVSLAEKLDRKGLFSYGVNPGGRYLVACDRWRRLS